MLRIFISPTRSGSGAFLRCFENNPAVTRVFHQPIKSGYRQDGVFDYSFFELADSARNQILVAKETVGGFGKPETEFSPLPGDSSSISVGSWSLEPRILDEVQPLVLMRDPMQTWGSIERLNRESAGRSTYFSPFGFFLASYKAVAEFAIDSRARQMPIHCVTQELLASDIYSVLPRVCERWSIPWSPTMIEWTLDYGVKTWFSQEAQTRMAEDYRFQQSKAALSASTRWSYVESPTDVISQREREVIEADLRPLYQLFCDLSDADFGA